MNIELRRPAERLRQGVKLLGGDYGVVRDFEVAWINDRHLRVEVTIDRDRGAFRVGPEFAVGVRIEYRVHEV